MIKSEELRKGNLLLLDGKEQEIKGIHPRGSHLFTDWPAGNWKEIERFEPVPITEERLEELGLRRNKRHEDSDYQRWEQCEGHSMGLYFFHFFINGSGTPILRLEFQGDVGCYTPNLKGVNYVHQLQNLYFFLIGEELIKKS